MMRNDTLDLSYQRAFNEEEKALGVNPEPVTAAQPLGRVLQPSVQFWKSDETNSARVAHLLKNVGGTATLRRQVAAI